MWFMSSLPPYDSSFVRQAVLCALNMAVVATPTNYLLSDLQEPLLETMLWVQGMHLTAIMTTSLHIIFPSCSRCKLQ